MFDRIKCKFYSILKRSLKDERGAVGILFMATLLVVVSAGVAVDATRANVIRERLRNVAETASSIALREYMRTKDIKKAEKEALSYVRSLSDKYKRDVSISSIDIPEGTTPKVTVTTFIPNRPGYMGIKFTKQLVVTSTSSMVDKNTEVAVVLDISGTMRESERMKKAQESLRKFSDDMFGMFRSEVTDMAISLVPYGGSVYFGPTYATFGSIPSTITVDNWGGCFRYWEPARNGWTDSVTSQNIYNIRAMPDVSGINPHSDPWCPTQNNRILEFAETSPDFTNAVNGLSYADGTSTDTGMAWGFRLLSQKWRGRFRVGGPQRGGQQKDRHNPPRVDKFPLDLKANTKQKHLILLTDGRINVFRSHYGDRQAKRNFQETCKNIGAAGIIMHIVSYDLTNLQANSELRACAQNGGRFYEAKPDTLQRVFNNIKIDVAYIRTTSQ